MKTKIFIVVIMMFLSVCGIKAQTSTPWDGTTEMYQGLGTEANPYRIENAKQLAKMAELMLSGEESYVNNHIVLMNNLDLGGNESQPKQWTPIGNNINPFAGNFDGNGKTISNIFIDNNNDNVGLFGYIEHMNAVVKNLGITENSNISGGSYVGAITGRIIKGTIDNCYNIGKVHAKVESVGGIAGYIGNVQIAIKSCFNLGDISSDNDKVGGIIGNSMGQITNCYNLGNISGNNFIGGIVGCGSSLIMTSYNAGSVNGKGTITGGICGGSDMGSYLTIRNCVYDLQMCSEVNFASGIKTSLEGLNKRLLISEMTNGVVFQKATSYSDPTTTWDETVWQFTEGMYPRHKKTMDLDIVKLYATPLALKAIDENNYETVKTVKSDFKTSVSNNVVWSSGNSSIISISGENATIVSRPDKTPVKVNVMASLNGKTKKIELSVLPNPFLITVVNPQHAVLTVVDNGKVLSSGDKVFYGSKLQFFAEAEQGYMLTGFTIDGATVMETDVTVYKDMTISATIVQVNSVVWDGEVAVTFGSGFGTEEKPYIIFTAQQLALLADMVAKGNDFTNTFFELANNLDLGGKADPAQNWISIGKNTLKFNGIFNGNGKVISDMFIEEQLGSYLGLFGYIDQNAIVSDIFIKNGVIKGNQASFAGGITGYNNQGTIKNCIFSGIISVNTQVGGIAGYNNGKISNCANLGNITGNSNNVGGITGFNGMSGTLLKNCYNNGNVKSGGNYVGGVVGRCDGSIENCYSSGSVSGSGNNIGGVAGSCLTAFNKCFYDKQMCVLSKAIAGFDDSDKAKGLLTSEMTSELFENADGKWVFETGYYPYFNSSVGSLTKLFATPIVLFSGESEGEVIFDTYDKIKNNFTLGGSGINWISGDEALIINGSSATVDAIKSKYNDFDLTATLDGNSKVWTVKVYPLEVTVNIQSQENGSIKVYNGKSVLTSGSVLPVYTELTFEAVPDDGYTLESFSVNGEEIDGNTLMLKNEVLITAKFKAVGGVVAWSGEKAKFFGGGTGVSAKTAYLIHNAEQLAYLANAVNNGMDFQNVFFKLMNNIDLDGTQMKNWIPIGCETNAFGGKFDGNGKTISNVYINSDSDNTGIFGYTLSGSEVSALGITGSSQITGKNRVGAIVGYNGGTVKNCFNSAAVSGVEAVGGIVGFSKYNVTNCYNKGNITANKSAGGIVGVNDSGLTNSYSIGTVSAGTFCGALVGMNGSSSTSGKYITNCFYDNTKLTIKGIGTETGSVDNVNQTTGKSTGDMTNGNFAAILKGNVTPNPWREDFTVNPVNDKYPMLVWQVVTVTLGEVLNGTVSVNGVGVNSDFSLEVSNGTVLKLKAVADQNYSFVKWWDGNVNIERDFTVVGNTVVSAKFLKNIEINVAKPSNGSIKIEYGGNVLTVDGSSESSTQFFVLRGTEVVMTAIPAEGYHFLNWNNDNASYINPYSVVADEDFAVSAMFDDNASSYSVTIPEVLNGEITVTSSGLSVNSGDVLPYGTTIHITATGEGEYSFIKWWDGSVENERDLVLERDVTVTALFEIIKYMITIETVEGGSLIVKNGDVIVNDGDLVKKDTELTLINEPAAGYSFTGYYRDGKFLQGDKVTVDKEMTLSAKFKPTVCKVSIVTPEHCSFVVMNGSSIIVDGANVNYGSVLNLSISVFYGYKFEYYTVNGERFNGNTVTVTSDVILCAVVNPRVATIQIPAIVGGKVTVKNGETVVNDGDRVSFKTVLTLEQQPDPGYVFKNFIVSGITVGSTFTVDKDECIISAIYESVSYIVTLPVVEGATITALNGYNPNSVKHGGEFKFKVTLKDDYSDSEIIVTAGEQILTGSAGVYTIANVTSDIAVSVRGVTVNTYIINIKDAVGGKVTVKNGNVVINDGDKVEGNVKLTLIANPDENYELGFFTVNGFQIYGSELIVAESITISAQFKTDGIDEYFDENVSIYSFGKTVSVQSEMSGRVYVFDMSGRVVVDADVFAGERLNLDIQNDGAYIVKFTDNVSAKIVKVLIK